MRLVTIYNNKSVFLLSRYKLLFCLLLLFANVSHGNTNYTWVGVNSNWNEASNWSPSTGYPQNATDGVTIGTGGSANPELNSNYNFANVTISDKILSLAGFGLTILGTANISGGTIQGAGNLKLNGTSILSGGTIGSSTSDLLVFTIGTSIASANTVTFSGVATVNVDVTVFASSILFNGGTLNGITNCTKTGAASNTSNGGTTFTKQFSFTNSGSGIFYFANTTGDTFNGNVTVTNTSTGTTHLGYNGTNTFNGNLILNNNGINSVLSLSFFNNNAGQYGKALVEGNILLNSTSTDPNSNGNLYLGMSGAIIQSNGKVSTGTFTSGNLEIHQLTQTTSQINNIVLSGSKPQLILYYSKFLGGGTFQAPIVANVEGNTFGDINCVPCTTTTTITDFGTSTLDRNWSSWNDIRGGKGNIFNNKTFINNNGSGTIYMSKTTTGAVGDVFNDDLTVTNTGAGTTHVGYYGTNTFKKAVNLNNNGNSSSISISYGNGNALTPKNSTVANVAGKITLNSSSTSSTSSKRIFVGYYGYLVQTNGGLETGTFLNGNLNIHGLIQNTSNQTTNVILTGATSILNVYWSNFYGATTFRAAGILAIDASKFGDENCPTCTTSITDFGAVGLGARDWSADPTWGTGNIYYGVTNIRNEGGGTITMSKISSGKSGDIFNKDLTVTNTNTGTTHVGYSGTNTFKGAVNLNNNGTTSEMFLATASWLTTNACRANIEGKITVSSSSTGRTFVGLSGYINQSKGGLETFNFTKGNLNIHQLVQSTIDQTTNVNLTGASNLHIYWSTFFGSSTFRAARIGDIHGSTFGNPNCQTCTTSITDFGSASLGARDWSAIPTDGIGNTYNVPTNIRNEGSGTIFMSKITSGKRGDVFNKDLTVTNTNTGTTHVGYSGTNTFKGAVNLNNNGTTSEMFLATASWVTSNACIANIEGKITVSSSSTGRTFVGLSGIIYQTKGGLETFNFTKGNLNIHQLVQSTIDQTTNVNLAGTSNLHIYWSTFFGSSTIRAPRIGDIHGSTFGNPNCQTCTTSITDFGSASLGVRDWSAIPTDGIGNIYHVPTNIRNEGSGTICMSKITSGKRGDIFNKDLTVTNTGTGSTYIGYSGKTVITGKLTLNNYGTSGSVITLARGASEATMNPRTVLAEVNGDIIVNSNSVNSTPIGINIGYWGSVEQNNGIIRVGIAEDGNLNFGFKNGNISLYRIRQSFTGVIGTNSIFPLPNAGITNLYLEGNDALIASNVFSASNIIQMNWNTFGNASGTNSFTHSGSTNAAWSGYNTFHGATSINNTGSSTISTANLGGDMFNNHLTVTNTGTGTTHVAIAKKSTINGGLTLNNFGTGGWVSLAQGASAAFMNPRTVLAEVNGDIIVNSNSGNLTSSISTHIGGWGSVNQKNGIIRVGTSAVSPNTRFGFNNGQINLFRINQSFDVSTPIGTNKIVQLAGAGNTSMIIEACGGLVASNEFSASNISQVNWNKFGNINGTNSLTHSGGTSANWSGNNTFQGATTINNTGSSTITTANFGGDVFNNLLTVKNASSGVIRVDYYGKSTLKAGVILNNVGSSIAPSGATPILTLGENGGVNKTQVFGDITVSAAGWANTYIGSATGGVSQNNGKITANSSSLLNIINLIQTNGGINSVYCNNLSIISCTLPKGGQFYAQYVHNIQSNKFGTKNDPTSTTITDKYTYTYTRKWEGGNDFNGPVSINYESPGTLYMANTNGDNFYNNVTYNITSGTFLAAYKGTTNYYGDLTYNSNVGSNGVKGLEFGAGQSTLSNTTEYVSFVGSGDQYIHVPIGFNSPNLRFGNLLVSKPNGKLYMNDESLPLNTNIEASNFLKLDKGNIVFNSYRYLYIRNVNGLISSSKNSFIEGTVYRAIGSIVNGILFPVGAGDKYAPIIAKMDAGGVNVNVRVKYTPQALPFTSSTSNTLKDISPCEYWNVFRQYPSGGNISFTLPWDATNYATCTPISSTVMTVAQQSGTNWIDIGNVSNPIAGSTNTVGSVVSNSYASPAFNTPSPQISGVNITFGYKSKMTINTTAITTPFPFTFTGVGYQAAPLLGGGTNPVSILYPDLNTDKLIQLLIQDPRNLTKQYLIQNSLENLTKLYLKDGNVLKEIASSSYTFLADFSLIVLKADFFEKVLLAEIGFGTCVIFDVETTEISCGANDATAKIIGIPNTGYSYVWSFQNETTREIAGLKADYYTVVVTDSAKNCTESKTFRIIESGGLKVSFNQNDNNVTLNVTGGKGQYIYNWKKDDEVYSLPEPSLASNLPEGKYEVSVSDKGSLCVGNVSFSIGGKTSCQLILSPILSPPSNYSAHDGSITVNVTGGSGDYDYYWSGPATFQNSATANLLTGDSYGLKVIDKKQPLTCKAETTFVLSAPDKPCILKTPLGIGTCSFQVSSCAANPNYKLFVGGVPQVNNSVTLTLSQFVIEVCVEDLSGKRICENITCVPCSSPCVKN